VAAITSEMTIFEILCQHRHTEKVFRQYAAAAGGCLCCQALFHSLEEVARRYGLDLNRLLDDLEQTLSPSPEGGG
jgi:hypothetical protein